MFLQQSFVSLPGYIQPHQSLEDKTVLGKIIWLKLNWWILDWWKVTALQLWLQCSAAIAMTLVAIGNCGKAGHCPLLDISCRAPRSRSHFWNTTSPSLWSLPPSSIWYSGKIQWKGWKTLLKRPPEFPILERALTSPWTWQALFSLSFLTEGAQHFPKRLLPVPGKETVLLCSELSLCFFLPLVTEIRSPWKTVQSTMSV